MILEREEVGRERERERGRDQLVSTLTGDPTHNLDKCTDPESNLQPFGVGMVVQLTEPL